MTGAANPSQIAPTDKPFSVNNIKSHVPIVLDLEKHNYNSWSELFKTHCMSYGVMKIIDGTEPSDNTTDPKWLEVDNLVKSWLYGTISEGLLEMVLTPGNKARDVWVSLKEIFHDNKDARVMKTDNDLRNMKLGNLSINEYFVKIKQMSEYLKNLGAPVEEKNLVMYAINGLGEKFSHIARILRHKDKLPNITALRTALLLEESDLNSNENSTRSQHNNSSSPTVLLAPTNNSRNHTDSSPVLCRNFQKGACRFGEQCKFLHWIPTKTHPNPPNNSTSLIHASRPTVNGRSNQSQHQHQQTSWAAPGLQNFRQHHVQSNWHGPQSSSGPNQRGHKRNWATQHQWTTLTPQHQAQPIVFLTGSVQQPSWPNTTIQQPFMPTISAQQVGWPTSQMLQSQQGIIGPPPQVSHGYFNQATAIPQAFSTMSLQDPGNADWNMDTGATDHLTSETGNLTTVYNKRIYPSVLVGDGKSIPVTNTGHSTLSTLHRPLHLHNVLVTPNIIKNHISVRKFARDNKCIIAFDEFGFSVKDYLTQHTLLRCDSSGDLYPVTKPSALLSLSQSTWHKRLGHPGDHVLRTLLSNKLITCNKIKSPVLCHACQLGKHVRLPFYSSTTIVESPFDIVHSDLWTSPIPSLSGIKYYIIFLDHFSHFLWVYPLHNKSDAFTKFLHFRSYVNTQFTTEIKSFQCDHGGEFDNTLMQNLFSTNGIQIRFSCPKTSQQNGKSERMIRTINNFIRTLLFQAHLPPHFWVEALHMATYLLNILPSTAIQNDTPYHKLFHKPPNYSLLRIFGCLCYPYLNNTNKLAPRSTPCIFLGYPAHHRGFRCLDLATYKIIISRHVTFDETSFPFGSMTPDQPPSYQFLDTDNEPNFISRQLLTTPSSSTSQPNIPSTLDPLQTETNLNPPATDTQTTSTPPTTTPTPPSNTHPMITRRQVGTTKPPDRLNLHVTTPSPVPKSHILALKDPHWHRAMTDEYNALIKKSTWVLVPRPPNTNIVRSMWLFKHKFLADGTLSRYKARLVANGHCQQVGIDCDETFSPVVKPATIRTVLSLAVSRQWPIHQLDVKNAFLNGTLSETVYMHQPPGFSDPQHPNHVCLLKKSLYGLKQAPRVWFQRFAGYATKIGFQQSQCDSSLFIFHRGSEIAYLLLYVDDIVLTASSANLLNHIITSFHSEFDMTDLGPLNYFLGISVIRNNNGIFLSQQKYASEILDRAHMLNCNPAKTPVDTDSKIGPHGTPVTDPTFFRSMAGALQYLTFTRPDITYAVQQVCLYMHDPREPHLNALKRILRYIRGTMDHGLQLYASATTSLTAYTDADWAGCPATRRSTSGYCVFLGENLLSWSSKRQHTVSRSSTEAEYRGVANVVAETSWLRNLLRELHNPLSKATIIYCDNVNAVYLSTNPVQHQRTKHIEIDIHFVRDQVAKGDVRVLHVPSRYQYADIFTKGLPSPLFVDFRSSLSVQPPPAQTAGAY